MECYGDCLEMDEYELHSRFRRAVNFSNGSAMVALVDRTIGPGPRHAVISGLDAHRPERLAITAEGLMLDGMLLAFASSRRYDSRTGPDDAVDMDRLDSNLRCFENCLGQLAPPGSLAFLLEEKSKPRWRTGLEGAVVARMRKGSELIYGTDLWAGIRTVKGLGFGLTPSGDDLLGGLLLALHGGQKIFARDFSRTIRAIRRQASGENPFSNAMLADASEGRAIGKIKDLQAAILFAAAREVRACARRLRTIGHSSGIDFGVGLLLTYKKLAGNKGEPWW